MEKKRVLLGSPVHQKPEILKEFIDSLNGLDQTDIELNYIFVDDNETEASRQILRSFAAYKPVLLLKPDNPGNKKDSYICDNVTHYWKEPLIWRVAAFKNIMIQRAVEYGFDYLFLIDSDLLLHPSTMKHLIRTGKDIISEIFWTSWVPGSPELPNVWLYDHYDMCRRKREESLNHEEVYARSQDFLNQLRIPGVYEVGGLGACTLISREAMLKGISFNEIPNLTLWGEDRHFCIRAQALGLKLHVDTHFPAYHIYREGALAGVKDFKTSCSRDRADGSKLSPLAVKEEQRPKLVLSMIMRNEADRYLERALLEHRQYIDAAVIIDDGSTDDSVLLCERILQGVDLHIIRNPISRFSNEVELRKQQWRETIALEPEWILNLDADEFFENRFKTEVQRLINNQDADLYYFRLYDFWNETHYREDQYWQAHSIYRPFLLRYQKDFIAEWQDTPQHCGRFPKNIASLSYAFSDLRLKHMGWSNPMDRLAKYERYLKLDPEARWGSQKQYDSILDPNPNLVEWKE
jgi:glycosyltransferase involved in cell wall biosynthesis